MNECLCGGEKKEAKNTASGVRQLHIPPATPWTEQWTAWLRLHTSLTRPWIWIRFVCVHRYYRLHIDPANTILTSATKSHEQVCCSVPLSPWNTLIKKEGKIENKKNVPLIFLKILVGMCICICCFHPSAVFQSTETSQVANKQKYTYVCIVMCLFVCLSHWKTMPTL